MLPTTNTQESKALVSGARYLVYHKSTGTSYVWRYVQSWNDGTVLDFKTGDCETFSYHRDEVLIFSLECHDLKEYRHHP